MVIHTGLANGLVRGLGGLAGIVNTAIELVALTGCKAVVVVILIVQLNFHVVVDVVVETKGISHALTAHDLLVVGGKGLIGIEVKELDAAADFNIAPLLSSLYAGELGTGAIVALLAAKEEVTALNIPAEEVPGGSNGWRIFNVRDIGCGVAHIDGLSAEALPVTRKFRGVTDIMVEVKVAGIQILLAVDVGRVAGAGCGKRRLHRCACPSRSCSSRAGKRP